MYSNFQQKSEQSRNTGLTFKLSFLRTRQFIILSQAELSYKLRLNCAKIGFFSNSLSGIYRNIHDNGLVKRLSYSPILKAFLEYAPIARLGDRMIRETILVKQTHRDERKGTLMRGINNVEYVVFVACSECQ